MGRIEKTRNDTARLVKSDLNFHLFFSNSTVSAAKNKKLKQNCPVFSQKTSSIASICIIMFGKEKIEAKQPKKKESSPNQISRSMNIHQTLNEDMKKTVLACC